MTLATAVTEHCSLSRAVSGASPCSALSCVCRVRSVIPRDRSRPPIRMNARTLFVVLSLPASSVCRGRRELLSAPRRAAQLQPRKWDGQEIIQLEYPQQCDPKDRPASLRTQRHRLAQQMRIMPSVSCACFLPSPFPERSANVAVRHTLETHAVVSRQARTPMHAQATSYVPSYARAHARTHKHARTMSPLAH